MYSGLKLERLFWAISLFAAFVFSVYLLCVLYSRYNRNEHYTKAKMVREKVIKLPTFSLCDRNYMKFCNVYPTPIQGECENRYRNLFKVVNCTVLPLTNCNSSRYWNIREGCISINSNGALKQAPGVELGLNFTVLTNTSSDIQLRIHDSEEPLQDEGYGQLRIMGSSYIDMRISVEKSKRLPHPFKSDCTDGENLENYSNTEGYSVTSCRRVCRLLKLIETCGIVNSRTFQGVPQKLLKKYEINVKNASELQEVEEKWTRCWNSELPKSFQNPGNCNCPPACAEVRYKFEPLKVRRLQVNEVSRFGRGEKVITIYAHYDAMEYIVWEEVPAYSLEQMIAEFGGLLGLLIGASFISILELLAFAWLSFLQCILNRIYTKTSLE